MRYTVLKIDEDLDYGCEETEEVFVVVALQDDDNNIITRRVSEKELLDQKIEAGSKVIVNEDNKLQAALDEDWTKNCKLSGSELQNFVDKMERVKSGEQVNWKCPFCGGEVGLLEQMGGHVVIGCHNCDMRITLDDR